MAYQMAPTPVTLNDLEGHSSVAGLCKSNFSTNCAAFCRISNDTVRRAVPRRQLGFLLGQILSDDLALWHGASVRLRTNSLPVFTQACPTEGRYKLLGVRFSRSAIFTARAMLSRYMPWSCVCVSVTSRCSTKMAKYRKTQTTPYNSPGTLVF